MVQPGDVVWLVRRWTVPSRVYPYRRKMAVKDSKVKVLGFAFTQIMEEAEWWIVEKPDKDQIIVDIKNLIKII